MVLCGRRSTGRTHSLHSPLTPRSQTNSVGSERGRAPAAPGAAGSGRGEQSRAERNERERKSGHRIGRKSNKHVAGRSRVVGRVASRSVSPAPHIHAPLDSLERRETRVETARSHLARRESHKSYHGVAVGVASQSRRSKILKTHVATDTSPLRLCITSAVAVRLSCRPARRFRGPSAESEGLLNLPQGPTVR